MSKDKDYQRLIHKNRWRVLRRKVLSEHPLCECCQAEGYITAACQVHHRVPVETAVTFAGKQRLMYDPSNLMALCHSCHVRIHTEMGRCGKEAHKKRTDEQVAGIINKFFGD